MSSCQISWRLVKPLLRCGEFFTIMMAAVRHLGFLTVRIFNRWVTPWKGILIASVVLQGSWTWPSDTRISSRYQCRMVAFGLSISYIERLDKILLWWQSIGWQIHARLGKFAITSVPLHVSNTRCSDNCSETQIGVIYDLLLMNVTYEDSVSYRKAL